MALEIEVFNIQFKLTVDVGDYTRWHSGSVPWEAILGTQTNMWAEKGECMLKPFSLWEN